MADERAKRDGNGVPVLLGVTDDAAQDIKMLRTDSSGRLKVREVPKQQTIEVAKEGGQFTSIQSAIDSVTDASATKWYGIAVHPGIYDEKITMKNFVSVYAVSRNLDDTTISATTGPVVTWPNGQTGLVGLTILLTATTDGQVVHDMTSGGVLLTLDTCISTFVSTTSNVTGKVMDIDGAIVLWVQSDLIYDVSGAASSATQNTHELVTLAGACRFLINDDQITVVSNDENDNYISIVSDTTTGSLEGLTVVFRNFNLNASYTGEMIAVQHKKQGVVLQNIQSEVIFTSVGGGTGIFVDMDSSGAAVTAKTGFNSISITGFDNNLYARVATTDILDATSEILAAVDTVPTSGAGQVNFRDVSAYGSIFITGGSEFTIDVADTMHAESDFAAGAGSQFCSYVTGLSATITAIADAGGGDITVTTSSAHGLSVGDYISITGTSNNDGIFQVLTVPTTTTFTVTDTFVATDTGTVHRGTGVKVDMRGDFDVQWNFSLSSAGNNQTLEFTVFKNTTEVPGIKTERKFTTGTDVGSMSGGDIAYNVEVGDVIWVAVQNKTSAGNFTITEGSVKVVKQS